MTITIDNVVAFCVGVLLAFVVTLLIAHSATNNAWERDAIRFGHARYDADTGEFKWNERQP